MEPTTFDSSEQPHHDAREAALRDKALDRAMEILNGVGIFDSIIILVSGTTEDGKTADTARSSGNWHAQNGMMDHFLRKRRALAEIEARKDAEE